MLWEPLKDCAPRLLVVSNYRNLIANTAHSSICALHLHHTIIGKGPENMSINLESIPNNAVNNFKKHRMFFMIRSNEPIGNCAKVSVAS